MGKYVEKIIFENEKIIKKGKMNLFPLSCFLVLSAFFGMLTLILISIDGTEIYRYIGCGIAFYCLINSIVLFVFLFTWELALTDIRVICKTGFLSRFVTEIPIEKIQSVSVIVSLLGKLFGYGYIIIRSASGKIIFLFLSSPESFKSELIYAIENKKLQNKSGSSE